MENTFEFFITSLNSNIKTTTSFAIRLSFPST